MLRFAAPDGAIVPVLPLALWAVMKETPGVLRLQAIQTGPDGLEVRLEPQPSEAVDSVWESLCRRVRRFLDSQRLVYVHVNRSPQLPVRDPKSRKYRHIWIEKKDAS